MHWIALLSFLIVIIIGTCQGQSGTIHVVSGGNGASGSESSNGADGSVRINSGGAPPGTFMKHDKDGQNTMQHGNNRMESGYNAGNFIRCDGRLPFFFTVFVVLMNL